MRQHLIFRLFCLTALLASLLLATNTFAQRLPECENTPEFQLPPEYPPTLCQEFSELPQPIPIVLGVPGWMTDADVNIQLGTVVLTNKVVYIQGDFTVLADFEFNNCWVSISPGKKIKVGDNTIVAEPRLNVSGSKFDNVIVKGIFTEPAMVMDVQGCTFINNGLHGIDVLKSDRLSVRYNQFTYTDDVIPNGKNFYWGIRFNTFGSNIIYNDQNISQNHFDVTFLDQTKFERIHCISMYGASDGATGAHYIDDNDFHMKFHANPNISGETRAISVIGGIHPQTDNTIFANKFEFDNLFSQSAPSCAINVTNGDYNNLGLGGNFFYFTYNQPAFRGETGIRLTGSTGSDNLVSGNIFYDSLSALSRAYDFGVFVMDFDNTNYEYNTIRVSNTCFFYHGTDENTNMICNDMDGGTEMLKLDLAVIGQQGGPLDPNGIPLSVNGNEWVNVQLPAVDAICNPATLADFSKFYVTGQQSPTNTFFPDILNPSSGWFFGGGPQPECVFGLTQNPLERSIADGTLAAALDNPTDA